MVPKLCLDGLCSHLPNLHVQVQSCYTSDCRKEKKREDYAFWRQFHEKPSIILGWPGHQNKGTVSASPMATFKQSCALRLSLSETVSNAVLLIADMEFIGIAIAVE